MADEAPKKTPAKKAPAKAAAPKSTAAKSAAPKAAAAKAAAPKAAASKTAAAESAPAKKAPAKAAESKAAAPKAAAPKTAAAKTAGASKTGTAAKAETAQKPAAKAAASKAPASAATAAKSAATPAKKAKSEDVARPQVLKMHHLRPAPGAKTARTRVGRGEGSKGKTAGRGTKGTKARYQVRVGLEGGNLNSVMRTPKLRGFKNPFRVEYQVVNLERLAELYPKGGDVTVSDLVAKGAVRKNEKVKVLGAGEIDVKLNVAVDKVSGSAEQKILAAGGSVK
jgi:large subunit ribosomal protein L15